MNDIQILRSPCEVRELFAPCCELPGHIGLPMSQPDWWLTCAETLRDDHSMYVFASAGVAGPTAAVAFARHRSYFAPLTMLGRRLREPYDACFRDVRSLEALATAVAASGYPIHIQRMPAESPFVGALQRAYRGKGLVITRPRTPYPYLRCDGGEQQVTADQSSSLRRDLRRAARLAGRMGSISYEICTPRSREELDDRWCEALAVEADSWKGRRGSALLKNDRVRPFYDAYIHRAAKQRKLRIALLRIDGTPAAMQIALQHANRFWLLKIGYSERFSRCSPGMLLIDHTLRHAANEGLETYELLGLSEPWTERWTSLQRPTVSLRAFPYTLTGLGSLATFPVRRWTRRIKVQRTGRERQSAG